MSGRGNTVGNRNHQTALKGESMKHDTRDTVTIILQNHSMYQPLPASLRKQMHTMRARQLRTILRKEGAFGVVPFAATGIYFFMKSRGLPIRMRQACIAARVLCIVVCGTISSGLLYMLFLTR